MGCLLLNLSFFVLMFVHAAYSRNELSPALAEKSAMVKEYGLTDLCLFTDARYTRHPSMADLNTPFQDYPLSFEHFPSGSLIPPPPHLVSRGLSNDLVRDPAHALD
ncbi:MAG: hypothetical protein C0402_13040 [Thermodesulfovibrio sp.]|nr:hypothetical protein [Thermodesulfovibrio sp.]